MIQATKTALPDAEGLLSLAPQELDGGSAPPLCWAAGDWP